MDGKQVINKANPTGTGKYLDERGVYVTVPGGASSGDIVTTLTANSTINSGSQRIVYNDYNIGIYDLTINGNLIITN